MRRNKRNIVRIGDMPGATWKGQLPGRGDNRFAGARQAMTSDPAYRGITATAPGQKYITRATDDYDDDEKQAAFDHRATAHFAPWFAGVMDKFGGLTEGAMRGSRLHGSYKDKAVAEGRSKAQGSKEWERDKRLMMTDEDQAFYDKYMNLADMAQDSTKAQEYRDTAETAWRNKQTSDRLAAATGFEDYAPSKYTGVGEGSRYTGSHREAGDFVPGVGIMRDIFDRLPAQDGYDMDFGGPLTPAGGPISITDNQFASGYDQELPAYSDEPVDITRDIGGSPYNLDALNLMPSYTPSLGPSFSDFATGKGQPQITRRRVGPRGMGQYETDIMRTYPGDPNAGDFTDRFPSGYEENFGGMLPGDIRNIQTRQTGTRAGPGSFDNFYMNEKGDVINRGSNLNPLPKIGVEFPDEDEVNYNPRLMKKIF